MSKKEKLTERLHTLWLLNGGNAKISTNALVRFSVLLLDWVRLMVVGLINVCLAITPLPERIYLAYVLWSIIGSGTVMVVHYFSNPTVFGDLRFVIIFFIGLSFGGLIGIILSFFKYHHKLKRGTAYLPV